MSNSIFWARLLGLYIVMLDLGVYINIKNFHTLMMGMVNNPALTMTMGIFTVLLGLAIVVNHQIWRGWPMLITILGYWITIKGMCLLVFPDWISKIGLFWEGKNIYFAPIPSLMIGLILLYCGFAAARRI